MTAFLVSLDVDARRSSDTHRLASELDPIFRAATVGNRDLDLVRERPKPRGGEIYLRACVDADDGQAVFAKAKEISRTIEGNRNLVDRIDEYRVSVIHADATGIVGYTAGTFRGWQREVALEELDAARRTS